MSSAQVTKNIPSLSSVSGAADAIARPKIMRRPAQFSSPTPLLIVQEPALNSSPEQPHVATINTAKPWQDDGRFAIALVLLLVAINLLVSVWLAPTAPLHAKPAIATQSEQAPAVTILNELNPPESNQ